MDGKARRKIEFEGDSKKALKSFPKSVVYNFGINLALLQVGQLPADSKPLKTGPKGIFEIRVWGSGNTYRLAYVCMLKGVIHVLHVFQKKSEGTSRSDLAKIVARHADLRERLRSR